MKLENGYGLYNKSKNTVKAIFHNEYQIVFEGTNHTECLKYCHNNGMKMINDDRWYSLSTPAFRKINAKHPIDESKIFIGTVY